MTMNNEDEFGTVREAELVINHHGLLVVEMRFNLATSVGRLVEYTLSNYDAEQRRHVGGPQSMDYVLRILQAFGVSTLAQTVGKRVRVLREPDGTIVGFHVDGGGSFDAAEFWRDAKAAT